MVNTAGQGTTRIAQLREMLPVMLATPPVGELLANKAYDSEVARDNLSKEASAQSSESASNKCRDRSPIYVCTTR